MAAIRTPERLRQVIGELREDLAADGMVYAELRLRPATDDDGVWDAMLSAAAEAAAGSGEPRLTHAGEAAGPESVRLALRLFDPSRIAHGVRAAEDSR